MNRHKQVCIGFIGDFSAIFKFDKAIVLAGIEHFHCACFLQLLPNGFGNVERNMLLVITIPAVTRIFPPVTRIEYHYKRTVAILSKEWRR